MYVRKSKLPVLADNLNLVTLNGFHFMLFIQLVVIWSTKRYHDHQALSWWPPNVIMIHQWNYAKWKPTCENHQGQGQNYKENKSEFYMRHHYNIIVKWTNHTLNKSVSLIGYQIRKRSYPLIGFQERYWFTPAESENEHWETQTKIDIENIWTNSVTKNYVRTWTRTRKTEDPMPAEFWQPSYLKKSYLTAISPNPSFATRTDEIASGIDVPTAIMTRAIVKGLISRIAPKCSTHSSIPNEIATIHKIAIVNDKRYHLRVSGVPHGGIVKVYRT